MKFPTIYGHLFAIALMGLSFSSCVDDYDYTPAKKDNAGKAYVFAEDLNVEFIGDEKQTLEILVGRPDSTEAGSVHLVSSNPKFQVPAEVKFAAGERTKLLTISCNIEPTTSEKVTIKVADNEAYDYGLSTADFTVTRYKEHPVNWQSWYYGLTFKNISLLEGPGRTFILRGAYAKADWIDSKIEDIKFQIDDENLIHIKPQPVHYQSWDDENRQYWISGWWFGDASDMYKTSDILKTPDTCGEYKPDDGIMRMFFHWYVPDFGVWTNGGPEIIGLLD